MMAGSPREIFLLRSPNAPPRIPDCWSWSSLTAWRRCPRRWWLERSHYPNAPTPYPQAGTAAAIEGLLLHGAVEEFAKHVADQRGLGVTDDRAIRSSFPVRRIMQQNLRQLLDKGTHRSNPGRLLSRVSIDGCVNAFRAAARTCLSGIVKPSVTGVGKGKRTSGAEVHVSIKDPKLCGRIDYVGPGAVLDFKTGSPKEDDLNQLRFYGLLVWLATGKLPAEMTVAYLRTNSVESLSVPTVTEMEAMAAAVRLEIQEIETDIAGGKAEARPVPENCRLCPVRQLCDEYWSSPSSESLRLGPRTQTLESPQWIDIELGTLPEKTVSGSYVGSAPVKGIGEVDVRIASPHVHAGRSPTGVRLLNALAQQRNGRWSVSAAIGSEAFWIEGT